MLAQHVARYLSRIANSQPVPAKVVLWDGTEIALGNPTHVTIRLNDRSALRQLVKPSLNKLGDAFVHGKIDIDGPMSEVIRVASTLSEHSSQTASGLLPRWAKQHSRHSDKKAISYHYDVSNEFYRLFLDSRMVYSCAYFENDNDSLEQAQAAKLDLICRKLTLRKGQHLLDIGCGWGAMAIYAAQNYDARVTGVTVSQQQFDLARERVAKAGLQNKVEIRLQDYRDIPERNHFDRISSIGMFEHVGLKHLKDYFTRIEQMLIPGGVAMNHGITSSDADSRSVGLGAGEFIGRYVFPNGELPHVSLAIAEMSRANLELVDAESLRRHYGKTLWHWSDRFEANIEQLTAIVGDERARIWRAYLAGCAYGFDNGWINVYQLLAAKPRIEPGRVALNHPMTRNELYWPNTLGSRQFGNPETQPPTLTKS